MIEGVVIGVTGRQPYSESWQRFKPTHDPQQGLHVDVAIDNNAPTVRAHISIGYRQVRYPFQAAPIIADTNPGISPSRITYKIFRTFRIDGFFIQ